MPTHVPDQARPSASEKNAETRPNPGVFSALPFPLNFGRFDLDQQPKRREIALVSGDVNEDFF